MTRDVAGRVMRSQVVCMLVGWYVVVVIVVIIIMVFAVDNGAVEFDLEYSFGKCCCVDCTKQPATSHRATT